MSEDRADGAVVTVGGLVTGLQRKVTKQGNPWAIVDARGPRGRDRGHGASRPSTPQVATQLAQDTVILVRGRHRPPRRGPEAGRDGDHHPRPRRSATAGRSSSRCRSRGASRRSSTGSRTCSPPTRASPRSTCSCRPAGGRTTVMRLEDRLRVSPTPGAVRRPQGAARPRLRALTSARAPTRPSGRSGGAGGGPALGQGVRHVDSGDTPVAARPAAQRAARLAGAGLRRAGELRSAVRPTATALRRRRRRGAASATASSAASPPVRSLVGRRRRRCGPSSVALRRRRAARGDGPGERDRASPTSTSTRRPARRSPRTGSCASSPSVDALQRRGRPARADRPQRCSRTTPPATVDYDRDIKPWLGKRAGVAAVPRRRRRRARARSSSSRSPTRRRRAPRCASSSTRQPGRGRASSATSARPTAPTARAVAAAPSRRVSDADAPDGLVVRDGYALIGEDQAAAEAMSAAAQTADLGDVGDVRRRHGQGRRRRRRERVGRPRRARRGGRAAATESAPAARRLGASAEGRLVGVAAVRRRHRRARRARSSAARPAPRKAHPAGPLLATLPAGTTGGARASATRRAIVDAV